MKNLKSSEIANAWVYQTVPAAKSPSALSFEGNSIFSYAAEIGRLVMHAGQRVVFLNTTKYSVTTSKHQRWVRRALPGLANIVEVPVLNDRVVDAYLAELASGETTCTNVNN